MDTVISIENLTRKFGDFTAVDGLNLDIFKNEIFGLLGPNGAGKTTTINMICGLLPQSEGRITFSGEKGKDRKSLIGYCTQENICYPRLTCLEQLVFIGRMYNLPSGRVRSDAVRLLTLLGLKEKMNVKASELSGGMKRRLNICLALIHDPEILVLDEPEAGLDPQSRILVRDFIKSSGKEKTIILTTHNMDEADRLADRIAIIDHGRLLLTDTPQNLKKTIGYGDILELSVESSTNISISKFTQIMLDNSMNINAHNGSVLIRHPSVIDRLAFIKSQADASGLTITEMKLRENTLEDVFINLTGRKLRQ